MRCDVERGLRNKMSGPVPFDAEPELPAHVEDALADALLRAPAERKRRLDALLERHRELEPALRARMTGPDALALGASDGARIGRYQLRQQIAEGGMGTVWLAEQLEPIKRRVAVKVIKLGMDTVQVMARFDAERQALAMMDHPHIAKVLGIGSSNSGSDHPNPTQPLSHPAVTPSTDLLPSAPPGHFARNPTP